MKRTLFLALIMLFVATAANAKTLRRGKIQHSITDDYNPVFPVACGSNQNPNASGCATFGTLLYQFLAKEFQLEDTEKGFGNFVYIGSNANSCLGATGAGLVMTPTSCIAYNANIRGTDTGNITFADNSTTWVAMDACNQTPSGCHQNNPGLPNFTRVQGTHYLIDAIDVSTPTMVTDSQLLMKVVTTSGSITSVTDLRTTSVVVTAVVPSDITVHTITPKNNDCTDSIGAFNGSRSGEINAADCSAFNYALYGMETATMTCTSGTGNCTCSGGDCKHFGVGQAVAKSLSAPAPTATSSPTLTVIPVTVNGAHNTTDGQDSVFTSGNTVFNPKCWGSFHDDHITCTNILWIEAGQTFIIGGTTYTAGTLNLSGNNQIPVSPILAADVTGFNITDGVTNTDTSFVSATAGFSSADVGRPVYCTCANNPGATACVTTPSTCPIATGTTIQTVTNSTTVVLSLATTGTGTGAHIFFGSAPVTGANITTTRRYKASFIYANGAYGPASAIVQTTASANALNRFNQVDVMSTTDANAIAEVFSSCEGAACTNFVQVGLERLDTMVWNAQTHTAGNAFLNDPDLISAPNRGGNKIVPTSIFFHDRGSVLDLNPVEFTLGSSPPPDAGSAGWYLGTIDSVGTGTVHVTPNVPLTVTSTMAHDGSAVLNEAWLNAEIAAQTGWTNPIMTGLYVPQGQYRIFNTLVPPASVGGTRVYGDGGRGDDVGSVGATSFVSMIEGNVTMAFDNQQALFEMSDFMIREGGGSTAGVCLDLDSPNSAGAATGSGVIQRVTLDGCNTGERVGNVNANNLEFIAHDQVWSGFQNNGGTAEHSWLFNSGNALGWVLNQVAGLGQTGVWSMSGGSIINFSNFPKTNAYPVVLAPFLSTEFNFSDARLENPSAIVRSFTNAGGGGKQNISLSNLSIESMEYDPSCAVIDSTSGGPLVTDKLSFEGVAFSALGFTQDPSVCPNGIVRFTDLTGTWNDTGGLWDNIGPKAYGNPFTLAIGTIGAPQIFVPTTTTATATGYFYNLLGALHLSTQVPPPTQPLPTFLTIKDACPNMFPNALGTIKNYVDSCNVANGCTVLGIPIDNSLGADFRGRIGLDINGQGWCNFNWNAAHDGSSGATFQVPGGASVPDACATLKNNPGTFNVYFDVPTHAIAFQNCTSSSSLTFFPTITDGGFR